MGARPSSPGGGPADKARERGAPTGRTGPGVFRPKRNDERRAATRFSRDGSPAEPPPGELGRVDFITGCLAGMDRRSNAARVSSPVVWPGWIAGRTPREFHYRLFGRDGSPVERRASFITGCLAGMDRRLSPHRGNWAAWVPPPAAGGPLRPEPARLAPPPRAARPQSFRRHRSAPRPRLRAEAPRQRSSARPVSRPAAG